MFIEPDPDIPIPGWFDNDIESPDYYPEHLRCWWCLVMAFIGCGMLIFGAAWFVYGLVH